MENTLFGTSKINENHHLEIGGCDTIDLAKEYGTPLFVYDVAHIRKRMKGFKQTFLDLGMAHKVTYASKAFSCIAIYQLAKEEGLSCDVVSAGELYTALKAGVPSKNIEFHGNNKSQEELEMAVKENVGTIIVDNFYEIELLSAILEKQNKIQKILLRVTPGVDAHTHEFILTGQVDSKFGFDVNSGQADKALQLVQHHPNFNMAGIHCHIGSQIFNTDGFEAAAKKMVEILVSWKKDFSYEAQVLNLGGGFGVQYTEEDTPLEAAEYVRQIATIVKRLCQESNYPLPEVWIEPGRSIVAEAGTTLYTVGSRKDVPNVRSFVALDGGMGDNIRPALYDAKYSALVANKPLEKAVEEVHLVGKYCESGDILIKDIQLPHLKVNDVVAIQTTGAYGYAMASNYNRNQKPAIVFVEDGKSQLVIRRETLDDLIHLDLPLQ